MKRSEIANAAYAFWPVPVTITTVIASVALRMPWLGPLILLPILFMPRLWWTCVFGLLNWLVIVGGIVACFIPMVRGLRVYL